MGNEVLDLSMKLIFSRNLDLRAPRWAPNVACVAGLWRSRGALPRGGWEGSDVSSYLVDTLNYTQNSVGFNMY